MISFMVLGGPRSGTTWAANWLTTDTTLCLHDPLLEYTLLQLEQLCIPGKKLGVSCTALLMYPDFVNASPAKKIILYRNVSEINASLRALGLEELSEIKHLARFEALKDVNVFPYEQLFQPKSARVIAKFLGVPFDEGRHDLLRQMRIEPKWNQLNVGKQAVYDLAKRISEAR